MSTLIFILLAYLVGSIPFSHLITKWRKGLNIRTVGDGNVGSRNVWHVVGPRSVRKVYPSLFLSLTCVVG